MLEDSEDPLYTNLIQTVVDYSRNLEKAARGQKKPDGSFWHNDFAEVDLGKVQQALEAVAKQAGLSDEDIISGEDTPKFFPVRELPGFVEALAADATGRDVSQFVDSLNLRIRSLFAAGPLASIADPGHAASSSLEEWLKDHVGDDRAANGPSSCAGPLACPVRGSTCRGGRVSAHGLRSSSTPQKVNGLGTPHGAGT